MRRPTILVPATRIVAIAIALVGTTLATAQSPDRRTISVSGQAELRVVPDEVVLTLGIETHDRELDTAKAENDARANALLAVTESLGIAKEHVRTDYLNIEPQYDHSNRWREFLGYIVRKTVVITLRDVDRFERLLTESFGAGANFVHGVDFRTTELRKHRDKARALALAAAREKAEAMAKELGQSVGKPRLISEGHSGWWSPYGSWWGSRRGGAMSQNVVQNVGSGSGSMEGPTAPGQISISATVSVTFDLVDDPG